MGFQTQRQMWGWVPIVKSHPRMIVLLKMAEHVHDTGNARTPARVYRGGHLPLAEALDYSDIGTGREPTKGQMDTLSQYVRDLVKIGALEDVGRAHHGFTAAYRVNLPPVDYVRGREVARTALP
ncbi:hypothetical protein [Demequina gelatinilytica]|uniref:hypothetical protein n=1 Tax=Demequina gelatinilytica TaxID=1638980 RepID=UPI000780CDAC|nr:hypothetical protein [Demequina gelatinilytica]